jgi:DNA-binding transcriptional LysR family regulator
MKMQYFNTLEAVIREGSFAAAAQSLNLSPSTVSLQMKRLEEYFGQPLFDRSSLLVRPTPFAQQIYSQTIEFLEKVEGYRRRPSPAISGQVKVGIIDSMQASLLPLTMRHLKDRYPDLDVHSVRGRSTELTEAVNQGTLDAAIVVSPTSGGSKRLRWRPLLSQELVMIAPPEAPDLTVRQLLETYEFIRFERGSNMARLAARYLSDRHISPDGTMEMQSTHAVIAMVSAGLGVAILFLPDQRLTLGFPVKQTSLGSAAPTMSIAMISRLADDDNRINQVVYEAFLRTCALLKGNE